MATSLRVLESIDPKTSAVSAIQLTLNARQLCDLELIANGGFAPLQNFMNKKDYQSVLSTMRLCNQQIFSLPIILDVDAKCAEALSQCQDLELYHPEGMLLATLNVKECWKADKKQEALAVYGCDDRYHPGVAYLYQQTKDYYVSGDLNLHRVPHHYDFNHLRHTPEALKNIFTSRGWNKIVAFQTRNPMHRAHQELTLRATRSLQANLLIHPVVGPTKPGDIDYLTRVRCYEHILKIYPANLAMLSLLPLAMRIAGPREALLHALVRKNYGCTHFIIGRDHAGPGKNAQDKPFYDAYAAQKLALEHEKALGIKIVPFEEMVYSCKEASYFPVSEFPADDTPATISGSKLREALRKQQSVPHWFSYPEVIEELRLAYPAKNQQGLTLFLTGLPSSGKSTLANALRIKLHELTRKTISLLDGDYIRHHISKGLGFSREDRETNITRVGFVAREITFHKGIAICALVAPFQNARESVREMVTEVGNYLEIYMSTPLAVCENRDRKGLYQKARQGLIPLFTGVSDVYEAPKHADITIDTSEAVESSVETVIAHIQKLGYL